MADHFDTLAQSWNQDPKKRERAQTTAKYCRKISANNKRRLLDFGGGTGMVSLYLHKDFDAITIADTSREMLKVARDNIAKAGISNIKTLELDQGIAEVTDSYSAIVTLMTLHHIADVNGFFRDAARVLSSGGVLLIADLYREDGSFHKTVPDFDGHNGFEVEELTEKLDQAGFSVKQVSTFFEIQKGDAVFPLFFLVAEKRNS